MPEHKIHVLYVDDEINNLTAFKAAFRRDYKVFIAQSGAEGRKILDENSGIQVIVTDQKMPEMTGVEFFESILQDHPYPVRILLTGYADIEAVISAINKGQIFRYITKPWDEQELRMSIENAYEVYHTRNLLKLKNEELQKTNNELNRFVYSASHDLRAPLMSILGITKLAKLENQDSDNEYIDMIERSVSKLDVFIQNIIEYYKNSRSEGNLDEIDFKELLEESIEHYRYYKDGDIDYRLSVDQDSKFISDGFRVKVVLNNIISNAIKYQKHSVPGQYVDINVKVDANEANITIKDNGIGISEEHQPNIFKMFFRATHEDSGSGIGLYIVKEALNKLDGDINLESTLGEGTTFQIKIPNKHE